MSNYIENVAGTVELNPVVLPQGPNHADLLAEIARLKGLVSVAENSYGLTAEKLQKKVKDSLFPWGKTLVKIPSEIETIDDIMDFAGLNYGVVKKPSYIIDGNDDNGNPILRETKGFSIQRADTGEVLSNVGPDYTPLQNSERFGFLQKQLEEKKISIEYAGDLKTGQKTVIIAKINAPNGIIRVGDEIGRYMVFSDTYDGLQSVRGAVMGLRLRCYNGAISQDNIFSMRIRHHANVARKVEAIADELQFANESLDKLFEKYQFLASVPFKNDLQLTEYVKEVMGFEEKPDETSGQLILPTRSKNTIDNIISKIHSGRGNGQGSWFDAYNGITEHFNHERGREEQTRLNSLLFGQSNRESRTALEVALKMAS